MQGILMFWIGINEVPRGIQADHASLRGDRHDLLISQVAVYFAQCAGVGMSGNHRTADHFHHIPERFLIGMRYVENHPQLVHFLNSLAAFPG